MRLVYHVISRYSKLLNQDKYMAVLIFARYNGRSNSRERHAVLKLPTCHCLVPFRQTEEPIFLQSHRGWPCCRAHPGRPFQSRLGAQPVAGFGRTVAAHRPRLVAKLAGTRRNAPAVGIAGAGHRPTDHESTMIVPTTSKLARRANRPRARVLSFCEAGFDFRRSKRLRVMLKLRRGLVYTLFHQVR